MKVAQNLAAYEFLNISAHSYVSIACDEPAAIFMQISIYKKMGSSRIRLSKPGDHLQQDGTAPFRLAGHVSWAAGLGESPWRSHEYRASHHHSRHRNARRNRCHLGRPSRVRNYGQPRARRARAGRSASQRPQPLLPHVSRSSPQPAVKQIHPIFVDRPKDLQESLPGHPRSRAPALPCRPPLAAGNTGADPEATLADGRT